MGARAWSRRWAPRVTPRVLGPLEGGRSAARRSGPSWGDRSDMPPGVAEEMRALVGRLEGVGDD